MENGADYVGIGPVWSTNSKDVTHKTILGCDGVGAILDALAGTGVEAVAIGTSSSDLFEPGLTRQAECTPRICLNYYMAPSPLSRAIT